MESEKDRLLGCKGELLDGVKSDISGLASVDCSRCLLTYCDESLDRKKWYRKEFDDKAHVAQVMIIDCAASFTLPCR